MRFKWRSHLMVTALAAFTMVPFTGCSSSQQQQQAGDEVEASEEQGEESGQAEASNQQSSGEETAATESEESGNPAAGNEVVTNDAVQSNAPAGEGDLQEIVQEMGNGSQGAIPAANDTAVAAVNAGGEEMAAPVNAAPVNAVPTNAAPAATAEAAPAPAAVGGLPETGSKMPYIVEAGDTLGKIATKVFGEQKRWRDISALTGLSNPNHIYPGDVVYYTLDEKSAQFAASYESIQRSKEIVQSGDTLASIAKRLYGSSRSWRHIWRQNDHIENPDKLETGSTIYYVQKDAIKTANKTNVKSFKTVTTKTLKSMKSISVIKTKAFSTTSYLV